MKGLKESVVGHALSYACHIGGGLSSGLKKDRIVCKGVETSCFAVCEGKVRKHWAVWSSALVTAASREVLQEKKEVSYSARQERACVGKKATKPWCWVLNGVLLELLASFVPAASKRVAVGTERAYLSRQPEGEVLVLFWKATKQTGGKCYEETIELLACVFVREKKLFCTILWFSSLKDKFSTLESEICFCTALKTETTALRAMVSFFRAV